MDLLLQKLQSEYSKNRNSKTEDKLKQARATTSQIRKQLEQLTGEVSFIFHKKWDIMIFSIFCLSPIAAPVS